MKKKVFKEKIRQKIKKFACGYLQNLSWLKDEHCMRVSVFKGEEIFNEFMI